MPLVRAGLYAPDDWRKSPKVLFDRTPAGILGRGAALDDESRRGGTTQRRLPQGALEPACTLSDGYWAETDTSDEEKGQTPPTVAHCGDTPCLAQKTFQRDLKATLLSAEAQFEDCPNPKLVDRF